MTVLRAGRGRPVTLIVPGQGRGPLPSAPMLAAAQWFAQDVRGTRRSFYYEESGHFDRVPPLRRQAERDAEEARVVADAVGATRALGISRGLGLSLDCSPTTLVGLSALSSSSPSVISVHRPPATGSGSTHCRPPRVGLRPVIRTSWCWA